MNILLLTSHVYQQRRRGGFHWLCDSFVEQGHAVTFLTVDFSLLTLLKGDRRTRHGRLQGLGRMIDVRPGLRTGILLTLTHPLGTGSGRFSKLLNGLTRHYPGPIAWPCLDQFIEGIDLVIFESNASLFLVAQIRMHSNAKMIYRVSDDLRVIRPVPALLAAETAALQGVDVVSVASPALAARLPEARRISLDPMGIDKRLFDQAHPSPYSSAFKSHIVCSGSSGFDAQAFYDAARQVPEALFVLIGEAPTIRLDNVLQLGEQPFATIVPYVVHADLGFAPFLVRPGVAYQADHSNRLLQYTYCGLASLVPLELTSPERPHYFGYDVRQREHIGAVVRAALGYDRSQVPRHAVLSWAELASRLIQASFKSEAHAAFATAATEKTC